MPYAHRMVDDKPDQPSWTPWAYVGTGIFGIVIVLIALSSGQANFIEAIILGVSVGVIIYGVKQLRERRNQ